jgi:head-to-tail connecting protein
MAATALKYATAPYESAGPTMLARQPAMPKAALDQAASQDWNTLRSHLESRLVMLRNWRQAWWTQNWSDLAEFILPRRSIWLTQSTGGNPSPNNMTRGRPINSAIADPTATYATRVCAGGLMSGLASPSRPWFKVVPAIRKTPIDAAGRAWLDQVEDRVYTVLAGSNFYNSFAQECEDLVVFGTGPSIIYEDAKDLIRLYNPAVGEYFLSSGATMRVDGLFRYFVYTNAQIVDFFGVDNCPQQVKDAWEQKGAQLEVEQIVAHAIEPNYGIGANDAGKLPGAFTWRETYWLYGNASPKPLSMRGFIEAPFTAGRWSIQSNDAYGRSPGMDVLPDVMQLQVMTRRMAEAIEKQVRPPLVGDMSLKNQPSSTLPGHLTYVANLGPGTGIRSIYEVNPDVAAMSANIMQIENRIKIGLFNDLFLMLEQAPNAKMTAYEVAQKVQEKMQVLGPVIESLITESLKPKLARIFGILKRKGMIDPPPPSLQRMPLDVEFVSMLALAQKAAATGGLERLAAIVGNMAPLFPTVVDLVDDDAFLREFNDLLGNPSKVLRGPEQVEQIRDQKAQQAQAQQKMAAMSQMAEAAGKAAPAGQVLASLATGAHGEGQGSQGPQPGGLP